MPAAIDHRALHAAVAALIAAPLALAGCETMAGAMGEELRASLNGAAEAPGPGDPDGNGSAMVRVDVATPQVCYEVTVSGIDAATMAHVHRGPAGVAGPPVVTLEAPADGGSSGCVAVTRELAAEMLARPADFYVHVHNAAFPPGAVRGQLGRTN